MRGRLIVVTVGNPAAGADFTATVTAGKRWALKSLNAQFVANATVANRWPEILLDDGATAYCAASVQLPVTASQTWQITAAPGLGIFAASGMFINMVSLPVGIELVAGHRIRSSTLNIQAGDQYSGIRLLVDEWDG